MDSALERGQAIEERVHPHGSTTELHAAADALIVARLRGLRAGWPDGEGEAFALAIVERAAFHRVHAILHYGAGRDLAWPPSVKCRLATLTRIEIASEMIRSHELARVLACLRIHAVDALLVKAASLAHQVYAFPALRPRDATDLLVRASDRSAAEARLRDLGYTRAPRIRGGWLDHGTPYALDDRFGCRHIVNLHGQLWNRPLLADVSQDELLARSTPLDSLGPDSRGLGPVDSTLVACVDGGVRPTDRECQLIATWDVARLADSLSAQQWRELCREADRRGLRRVCLTGLRDARRLFGAALPSHVVATLAHGRNEPAARLLRASDRDLALPVRRAQDRLVRRLRSIGAAVLPHPDGVREWNGVRSTVRHPVASLRRAVSEVRRRTTSR